ncbi:AAA family ATPase [Vibrio breoganii]|uniref:AAA family ATPase n=1 Tax=Vibrio breoganii TaxID=553239 RepID=UPI000C84C170|nr:helicase RepA family protein [Vibrio breoganii]
MGINLNTNRDQTIRLSHERVLATAIVHEVPLALHTLENIELSLFSEQKYKQIVAIFKAIFIEPHKQPNNKQVADTLHQELINIGYSSAEADSASDDIENLVGFKRVPDAVAIASAIEALSVDSSCSRSGLFEFKSGSEGFDEEFSYLIKGYLPASALGMIYGSSGSFKSFHALSWACHVSLGIEWNNCKVNKQPVLYIAGEGGIGVPRRIRALEKHYNDGEKIENLYRLDFPIAMGDVNQVNQLALTIGFYAQNLGVKFGLVIIDTLARCFGSGDENKTDDMGRFVAACDRLKAEAGVTVMVVHHSGVGDKGRARGSSALKAACDFEYRVDRSEGEGLAMVLSHTKSKDDKEQLKQLFNLVPIKLFVDSDQEYVTSLVAENQGQDAPQEAEASAIPLSKHEQTLYQIVRSRLAVGESATVEIVRDDMKAQGLTINNFSRWLSGAISKGVISEENGVLVPNSLSD